MHSEVSETVLCADGNILSLSKLIYIRPLPWLSIYLRRIHKKAE